MQNFVVYKSSAGSGKTFTLVKEYLRLALFDEKKLHYNYKRILAVTFTNKAASEMKARVVDALNQLAHGTQWPFIGTLLCEELGIDAAELKSRANIVLGQILHHYSDFSIGTIDSFTHKIVKTFAHDLKLPVNFNIELDTESFYEKVIASLFGQVGEDAYVSKLLKEYVLTRAEDNASWDPQGQITEFARLLQKEHSEQYLNLLKPFTAEELEGFRKQFLDFIAYYKKTLKAEAQKVLDLVKQNGLTENDFAYKGAGTYSFFRKCADGSVTLQDANGSRLLDAVGKQKWAAKDSPQQSALLHITPELTAMANSLIDFVGQNYTYFALCEVLARQMYPLMLLKKIEEISLEKKQEERLVFISEFNHKIFEIIHNEPTPFIYERLGERYHHYLLDEFQDTSSLQWQNILPLLDNSLGGGWFNLVVGDGKQSIYRWRNANVQQFAALPQVENADQNVVTASRAQSLKRNFEGKLLDTNYRSLKTIIDFNNGLFDFLSDKLLSGHYKNIYEAQAQKVKHGGTGYITVNTSKTERDEVDAYIFNEVNKHIQQALSSGFAYKDICILCRKNQHGNQVANYLVEQHIPVVSSDSLLLKNNLEINTILSYLAYRVNNRDAVSGAAVLNYLLQSGQLSEQNFHKYANELSSGRSLFDILNDCGIELHEDDLALNNLLDNCIAIIKALQLNVHGYSYTRFFLDEVNEFLVLKNSNIPSFFEWWENRSNRASMVIPQDTNAVHIMTIHASKGLEFPVVIVPYCNWSLYKANDSWVNVNSGKVDLPVAVIGLSEKVKDIGFEKELETEKQEQLLDNLNLLYVAFTRAVERLHIITTAATSYRLKSVADWVSDFMQAQYKPAHPDYYEIGQLQAPQLPHGHTGLNTFALQPLRFDTNDNVVQIKAAYRHNSQEAEDARQQGIVMHWILSKITSAADLEPAMNAALLEGLIRPQDIMVLTGKLQKLIQHPNLQAYFAPGLNSKREAELVTAQGQLLRPDRIIFTPTETVLIDYKTGKENNKSYFKQMHSYEAALQAMGYPAIKKLLVYIDDLSIVDVM